MKYTQKYLDSLKGLEAYEARTKVAKDLNMICSAFIADSIITAIARDCVCLFIKDGVVMKAVAGDPTKLVDESS